MAINNTFLNTNHPKSVLSQLKSADGLPFKDVLSSETIGKNMEGRYEAPPV